MVTTNESSTVIDSVVRDLRIGIDSDVVIASSFLSSDEEDDLSHNFWNITCPSLRRYKAHNQYERTMKSWKNGTDDKTSPKTNKEYVTLKNDTMAFYLIHVYKIRVSENSSMQVNPLGAWNPETRFIKTPLGVKLRTNFHGFPIKVGIHNGTKDVKTDPASDEEINNIEPLIDFMHVIANSSNTTIEVTAYEKIGTVTNKAWSDLLGDVVSGNVDIGLGYITISTERQQEMSFSYPLVKSMRNVYYSPPFYGSMRNIFLEPFNYRLLLCVAGTFIMIVAAMEATTYVVKAILHNENERDAELGEATLWCLSIMCMQGSPWTPKSRSGKAVLLSSLFFALVIYNAYSGFITSILSVQNNGIKTLDDLLQYNYFKLGYSINEDEYIRSSNDSNLRKLYIKAFDNRESRLETVVGLKKAIKGNYGFFVGAADARKMLQSSLIRNQCSLKELQLEKTFSSVALPMAHSCPYKKIINLSIFRIREHGVLDRIKEKMLPEMPKCQDTSNFNSASLVDVYSAFGLLLGGMVISLALCLFERIWTNRIFVQDHFFRSIRAHRRNNLVTRATGLQEEEPPARTDWSFLLPHPNLREMSAVQQEADLHFSKRNKFNIHDKTSMLIPFPKSKIDPRGPSPRKRKKSQHEDILNTKPRRDLVIPFQL
ncbi:glutamate receptor 4-like [Belonocnema kinseyi]|uniref:glutamate receptor 4-like n=1 Tax=Belonocnema kinseyi TaxID=2817044 RepID=UPI00143CD7FA|nr:glutamate receptor 4-like [Belonocnema kinseyi]